MDVKGGDMGVGTTRPDTSTRAVAPVLATVLLVAVVAVLGATTAVGALAMAEEIDRTAPTAAFESEQDGDRLRIAQVAGDTIDASRVSVSGGELLDSPADRLAAGSTIEVRPTAETVQLRWADGDRSSILYTTSAEPIEEGGATLVEVPAYSQAQYDFFLDRDLSDPFVLEVHAVDGNGDPYTGTLEDIEIEVSNHYGSFDEAPEDSYLASETLTFDENGVAELTLGNGEDVDVDYWGLDVNEITETVEIDTGDVETTVYLRTETE